MVSLEEGFYLLLKKTDPFEAWTLDYVEQMDLSLLWTTFCLDFELMKFIMVDRDYSLQHYQHEDTLHGT